MWNPYAQVLAKLDALIEEQAASQKALKEVVAQQKTILAQQKTILTYVEGRAPVRGVIGFGKPVPK